MHSPTYVVLVLICRCGLLPWNQFSVFLNLCILLTPAKIFSCHFRHHFAKSCSSFLYAFFQSPDWWLAPERVFSHKIFTPVVHLSTCSVDEPFKKLDDLVVVVAVFFTLCWNSALSAIGCCHCHSCGVVNGYSVISGITRGAGERADCPGWHHPGGDTQME